MKLVHCLSLWLLLGVWATPGQSQTICTVTFKVTPVGGGRIVATTVKPQSNVTARGELKVDYPKGTEVDLVATAEAGYDFVGWEAGAGVTSASRKITVNESVTVTAYFKPSHTVTFDLQPAVSGQFTVTSDDGQPPLLVTNKTTREFVEGTTLTLSTSPDKGEGFFTHWNDDPALTTPSHTATVGKELTLTAHFQQAYRSVYDVQPPGSGYVDVVLFVDSSVGEQYHITTPSVQTYAVMYMQFAMLTANASPGYMFDKWKYLAPTQYDEYHYNTNVYMSYGFCTNTFITAIFRPLANTYVLTLSPGEGGSIAADAAPTDGRYAAGTSVTLTAKPKEGYRFERWEGDASGTDLTTQVRMETNRTVTARFVAIAAQVTVSVSATAGGTAVGGGTCTSGATVTVEATPNSGYRFLNWTENGSEVSTSARYAFTASGNRTLQANFETLPSARYKLSLTASDGGSIAAEPVSGDGSYADGTVVSLTAKPNTDYQFVSWGGDASGTNLVTQVTLAADRAVTAAFTEIPPWAERPGLRRQIYTDIAGTTVADLVASTKYRAAPEVVDELSALESQYLPNDAGDNYGQRLTGWLVPPYTGDYVFFLAADDQAQVFLSTDDFPANKRLIVQEPAWGPARNWAGTADAPQRASATIPLVAHRRYYVEVLHKESAGVDHVGVAWQLPGGGAPRNGDPPIGKDFLVYQKDMPEALWTALPADGGRVRLSPAPPAGGRYPNGTVVTLTAVPASGYRFTGWSGALSGTANPSTLTVQGNLTATANFALGDLDVTQPGDSIVAFNGNSPGGEGVTQAIDDRTDSKFFTFEKADTGLTVTPKAGASVVTGLGLTSANDCPERDPAFFLLYGSHDGWTFSPLASGGVPLFTGRHATWKVFFTNDVAYEVYRLIFPTVLNPATALGMQIAEVELYGAPVWVTYGLTLAPEAGGAIEANPSSSDGRYAPGTQVTLTARANPGYRFDLWGGAVSGTNQSTTVTLNGDTRVTASFVQVPVTYALSLAPGVGGSIDASPGPADGRYTAGTQVTLTARPASGYQFQSWGGAVGGTSATATVTMNNDTRVTASFVQIPVTYALTLAPGVGGSIDATPASTDGRYAAGTQVTLTARPASGYQFQNWGGAASGTSRTIQVTMTGNLGISASFVPIPATYFLTLVPGAGGQIEASPSPTEGRYAAGTQVTLTARPNSGYQFQSWGGAASGASLTAQVTMTGNLGVTASFVQIPATYALTLAPGTGGSIEASPATADGRYTAGTQVTLTARPASGYQFSSWGGAASGASLTAQLSMAADLWVTASFVQIPVTVYLPGLRRQLYLDIPGTAVADLTGSAKYPATPDAVDTVSALESEYLANDAGENYGERLTGWLVPPASGDYVFYLAADDQAQMFLSPDDFPANKRLIVQEPSWSPARNWAGTTANPQRASAAIALVANQRYYLEVLHKEGTGEDHVGVAWQLPGGAPPQNGDPPIGSEFLVYLEDMPEALWTVQPADGGTVQLSPAPPAGGRYADGAVVTLTAVPAVGYRFTGWSGALSGTANPSALTVAGNPTVTAQFTLEVADITQAGDPIVAIGGSSPSGEGVAKAIDNQTSSKYFNYGKLNTGFTVTPKAGATVVMGLGLTSANDCPERDPASYRLEGSRDGRTYTAIAAGTVPAFAGRFAAWRVFFSNSSAYTSYRLLFPTVANANTAIAMQIAEVELLGAVAPKTPPRLVGASARGVLTLTWEGSGWILEATDNLHTPIPWTAVSGASGNRLDVPCQGAARFYRLRQ